jgi:hypothetical protein
MKKRAWRIYSEFLKAETREEAESILARARDFDTQHLLRLAPYFAETWGRMPDEFHNMAILFGGKSAAKYLDKLGGSHGRGNSEEVDQVGKTGNGSD